ncbi:MAG: hypothetical protein LBK46_10350, partial [Oscillospiraceae bacterium]|nr:hypothetical protein [Oscillospiraceae bacterium]
MARHAYMIMAHTNFSQLKLLLILLDHPDNDIYVHIDMYVRRAPLNELAACCRSSPVLFTREAYIRWGKYSMFEAELALLRKATETEHAYYHLVSGMDMPLKTQDEIHDFYAKNGNIEFVAAREYNEPSAALDRLIKKAASMGMRGFKVYKGSQWFSITHEFAVFLLKEEPTIKALFENYYTPDEKCVQTLLMNSRFRRRWSGAQERQFPSWNMRLIEWPSTRNWESPHPKVFTMANLDQLTSSACHFARKFDMSVDTDIITILARRLVGQSAEPSKRPEPNMPPTLTHDTPPTSKPSAPPRPAHSPSAINFEQAVSAIKHKRQWRKSRRPVPLPSARREVQVRRDPATVRPPASLEARQGQAPRDAAS